MITVVLTYRDKDLRLVENCLDSLKRQNNTEFKVVFVDYGSTPEFNKELQHILKKYTFATLIRCETEGQLWCKSRAINIALKQCSTDYFFVGDVDMIFHPNFIEKLSDFKQKETATYFKVGFLSESESKKDVAFEEYTINFESNAEATGMTLFPTEILKSVNGYDEFYHGWGAEDTDVHVRLQNAGYTLNFYDEDIQMLHQWHPKSYRTLTGDGPFHSGLEKINHQYLKFSKETKKVKANTNFPWGMNDGFTKVDLEKVDASFILSNLEEEIKAFISNVLLSEKNKVIQAKVKPHEAYQSVKEKAKKIVGKKTLVFLDIEHVNNLILETIILNLRNQPYHFYYNTEEQTISLTIKL